MPSVLMKLPEGTKFSKCQNRDDFVLEFLEFDDAKDIYWEFLKVVMFNDHDLLLNMAKQVDNAKKWNKLTRREDDLLTMGQSWEITCNPPFNSDIHTEARNPFNKEKSK